MGEVHGPWRKLQYGFWEELSKQTGIFAARWRKAFNGYQRPTLEMIQALCWLKPEYAFWIVTGITDAENGHKAPQTALTFPEWRGERASDEVAIEHFQTSLGLVQLLTRAANVDVDDRAARLDAFGCVMVGEEWQPNPVVDAAVRKLRETAGPSLKELNDLREALRDLPIEDRAQEQPARPA